MFLSLIRIVLLYNKYKVSWERKCAVLGFYLVDNLKLLLHDDEIHLSGIISKLESPC